jgi:UrcA family protein
MSRVAIPAIESATGVTADLFSQIKKAVGKVPNTFAVIGALDTPNLSLRRLAMTTSTTVKALSGSLPAAFAIVALAVFSAGAHAATPGQITIYGSTTNTVGRDYAINAPIQDTTVKVGVSYDPGTLTTKSGIERLNDSVRDAARKACEIADPFTDDETCIRQAIDSAQPQIARAIAQARTSTTGS